MPFLKMTTAGKRTAKLDKWRAEDTQEAGKEKAERERQKHVPSHGERDTYFEGRKDQRNNFTIYHTSPKEKDP